MKYLVRHRSGQISEEQSAFNKTCTTVDTYTNSGAQKPVFPYLSLPKQTAIAKTLRYMDAEIAALEGKLSKARQVKQGTCGWCNVKSTTCQIRSSSYFATSPIDTADITPIFTVG